MKHTVMKILCSVTLLAFAPFGLGKQIKSTESISPTIVLANEAAR